MDSAHEKTRILGMMKIDTEFLSLQENKEIIRIPYIPFLFSAEIFSHRTLEQEHNRKWIIGTVTINHLLSFF